MAIWGTWAVYVLDADSGVATSVDQENQPRRAAFFRRFRMPLFALIFLSAIPLPGILWHTTFKTSELVVLGFLGAIGLLYVAPLIPTKSGRATLKDLGEAKSFIITVAWAIGGVGVPLTLGKPTTNGSGVGPVTLVSFVTLLLFLDTLLLDLRDRGGDMRGGVRTAATALGRHARRFLWLGTIALAPIAIFGVISGDARALSLPLALITWALCLIVIQRSKPSESAFAVLVSLWRFIGAAYLLLLYFCT